MDSDTIASSSGEEEAKECEYCHEIIEDEEIADTTCGCVMHEECRDHKPRKIKCYACPICESPYCDICAHLKSANEKLASKINQLEQQIKELTKQLSK